MDMLGNFLINYLNPHDFYISLESEVIFLKDNAQLSQIDTYKRFITFLIISDFDSFCFEDYLSFVFVYYFQSFRHIKLGLFSSFIKCFFFLFNKLMHFTLSPKVKDAFFNEGYPIVHIVFITKFQDLIDKQ